MSPTRTVIAWARFFFDHSTRPSCIFYLLHLALCADCHDVQLFLVLLRYLHSDGLSASCGGKSRFSWIWCTVHQDVAIRHTLWKTLRGHSLLRASIVLHRHFSYFEELINLMDSKHAKAKRFNFMKLNKKITWVNYWEKKKFCLREKL